MPALSRHRRSSESTQPGLFSHVLSFVSREFESFVVNATARPASQPVSTGRIKRRGRDLGRHRSEDEARYRSNAQHRQRPTKPEPSRRKRRSNSTDACRRSRHDYEQPTAVDDDRASDRERSPLPAPPSSSVFPAPPPPTLKKQPSMTMPGSLFPRSPSLVPDMTTQMTSYSSLSVHPSRPTHAPATEPGPSKPHAATLPPADVAHPDPSLLDQYVSPWRTRSVASVKDAIHRFNVTDGVEADFSLMLPSPQSSPAKPMSKTRSVDEASPNRPAVNVAPLPTSRKGKERARDSGNEDDLEFIVRGDAGPVGVHAKERELNAAREEQRAHERRLGGDQSRRASDECERDKRRIKALEEEVRQLKEQLSRSQMRSSPPPSLAPPPPPPPPPPVPLRIDTAPYTPTTMFATARASLRHAMTPVEAPINNPGQNKTKRQGQPTVNVPSEKMAAFLLEIKTAKLRKVGSGTNAMGGDGIAGPSGLSKSVSVTATSSASTAAAKLSAQELKRRRSLASLRVPIGSSLAAPLSLAASVTAKEAEIKVGQKRKADALGVDELTSVPSKRRMTQPTAESCSGTSQHTTSSSEISPRSSFSLPSQALPTNETDVTTPSLCSDNDRDENSIEDRVLLTPPRPRTPAATRKASKADAPEEQIEVIDVDMEEQPNPEPRAIVPNSVPRRNSQLFKKRPPTSPIPIPTPRRPSAPARTRRGATPKPKCVLSLESDVEDEDNSQPAPIPFLSLIPVPKSKPTKVKGNGKPTLAGKGHPRTALPHHTSRPITPSGGSNSSLQNKRKKSHKRRQTLDEELRTAEARSSDMDDCNDELDRGEDDVFTATGTMSKRRGFLAHGGGGGTPVFMGAGFVEGVALGNEDGDIDEDPRRSSKSTQPCLIPRPKGRT